MPIPISASGYNIELRDKDGNLKHYLTPFVTNVSWEWNRIGGCGNCSLTIHKPYRSIAFDARDDIQIRVKNEDPDGLIRKLLINFDGADAAQAYIAETGQTVTFAGTAQLDTAQKASGDSSLLLDGNSDYVTLPDSGDHDVGTADFLFAVRGRFAALPTDGNYQTILSKYADANNYYTVRIYNSSGEYRLLMTVRNASSTVLVCHAVVDIAVDTWYRFRISRKNGVCVFYLDSDELEVSLDSGAYSAEFPSVAETLKIGSLNGDAQYFNGWVDSFEFWKYQASKLVYRGYISNATPTLDKNETIKINVRGYFDLFKKLIVHDTGDKKTYTTTEVSVIVDDIIDTFVVSETPIAKGVIDVGTFECDSIQFLTTVEDALNTLAQLAGDAEYGVDENLVFFWRTESISIRKKFVIGDNVTMLERKVDYDKLVNRAYLVGGTVAGSKYKRVLENTDSQALYYLAEKIISNGSIVTDTVADQYLGSVLSENAQPQLAIRARIANTPLRLEDSLPIGLIVFYDVDYDKTAFDSVGDIIGEAADGGSDITIGETADGGDDVVIGGQYSAQVDRIQYDLSETGGRFNLTIQFGDTILETAALIKRLELALSNLQQYD